MPLLTGTESIFGTLNAAGYGQLVQQFANLVNAGGDSSFNIPLQLTNLASIAAADFFVVA